MPHIEKCHVIGGRIKGIAVAQPRRIVNLDVCEAQLLKHARGLRRTRATLAVDNVSLLGSSLEYSRFRSSAGLSDMPALLVICLRASLAGVSGSIQFCS